MAIIVNFNGAQIYKPGFYGDPVWTPFFHKYGEVIQLLAKLGVHDGFNGKRYNR